MKEFLTKTDKLEDIELFIISDLPNEDILGANIIISNLFNIAFFGSELKNIPYMIKYYDNNDNEIEKYINKINPKLIISIGEQITKYFGFDDFKYKNNIKIINKNKVLILEEINEKNKNKTQNIFNSVYKILNNVY